MKIVDTPSFEVNLKMKRKNAVLVLHDHLELPDGIGGCLGLRLAVEVVLVHGARL